MPSWRLSVIFQFCVRLGKHYVTSVVVDEETIHFTAGGQPQSVPKDKIQEIVTETDTYDADKVNSNWDDIQAGRAGKITAITEKGWTTLIIILKIN